MGHGRRLRVATDTPAASADSRDVDARAPPPEEIDVRTSDGWSLRTAVTEPRGECTGTVVLAHALMARRSEFDRPRGAGLTRFFADRGWRVVAFDFRGHGDSTPPPRGRVASAYDDFVREDLPAVFAFAESRREPRRPILLVGHSLGGHVGLAAQGVGRAGFDGIVAVASDIWLHDLEPSGPRWLVKRASLRAAAAIGRRVGRFPARALRMGSDDETSVLFDDLHRFARTGAWLSADGRVDYLASLARVRVPVLQMVSDGDRLQCPPECGARFVARCGGRHEVLRVTRGDRGGPAPTHMGLVTDASARASWDTVERWMRRTSPAPVF